MAELSLGGFRLLTVFWCYWEVLFHLQYHFGLSGQQGLSLILVFLPLAFNSLCLPLVKITKSCKKLENFLSLPANSLGCHDLMELAGDWRFLGYRQQVLFLTGQQIAWVLCSHRISFPTKSLGNKVKVGQLDAIHGVGTWNSELRKPQFL